MSERWQFRFKQLLAILAAYGFPLWLMWSSGTPSIITVIVASTALSGIVLIGRGRYEELIPASIGGVFGSVFGISCLSVPFGGPLEGITSSMKGAVIGTTIGAVLLSQAINTSPDNGRGFGPKEVTVFLSLLISAMVLSAILHHLVVTLLY